MNEQSDFYVKPPGDVALEDCYFYHETSLPGVGKIPGEWLITDPAQKYLGGVTFAGKRVLELGPASGLLTAEMERQGATVVVFDAAEDTLIDMLVPGAWDPREKANEYVATLRSLHNSFWFTHRALGLQAKAVYGDIYHLPDALGRFDVTTLGCILLHLRDPFRALQQALRFTDGQVVITETLGSWRMRCIAAMVNAVLRRGRFRKAMQITMLQNRSDAPQYTYWLLPPALMRHYLDILGFRTSRVLYHYQRYRGTRTLLYTLVADRTGPGMHPIDTNTN